jgi:hypothetical protein
MLILGRRVRIIGASMNRRALRGTSVHVVVSDAITELVADIAYSMQPGTKAAQLLAGNALVTVRACSSMRTSAVN